MKYDKNRIVGEISGYLMGFSKETVYHIYKKVIEKCSGNFKSVTPAIIYDSVQDFIREYFTSQERGIENIADYDIRKMMERQLNAEKRSVYNIN